MNSSTTRIKSESTSSSSSLLLTSSSSSFHEPAHYPPPALYPDLPSHLHSTSSTSSTTTNRIPYQHSTPNTTSSMTIAPYAPMTSHSPLQQRSRFGAMMEQQRLRALPAEAASSAGERAVQAGVVLVGAGSYHEQQQQQQQQQQQSITDHDQARRRRIEFALLIKILLKVLWQAGEVSLYHQVKIAVRTCTLRHKMHDPSFEPMEDVLEAHLWLTVGDEYWNRSLELRQDYLMRQHAPRDRRVGPRTDSANRGGRIARASPREGAFPGQQQQKQQPARQDLNAERRVEL